MWLLNISKGLLLQESMPSWLEVEACLVGGWIAGTSCDVTLY